MCTFLQGWMKCVPEVCCKDASYQSTIAAQKAAQIDGYDASSCHLDCGPVGHDHSSGANANGLYAGISSRIAVVTILATLA